MSDLSDWINVDVFVFGVYRGKTRCHKDSLIGRLAEGDYTGAMTKTQDLIGDVVAICEDGLREVDDE